MLAGVLTYAAHMMQIPNEIKNEFVKGDFVVECSKQKFSQVDPDHAQNGKTESAKLQEAL